MNLGELLQEAIEMKAYGLQSLIMLVVFEKQVLSLEDDESELDLYFKPNNAKRINQILKEYQKKIGINHDDLFFQVNTDKTSFIVKADNQDQATNLLKGKPIKSVRFIDPKTELVEEDKQLNAKARYVLESFAKNQGVPSIVSQF
ncbi:hypothetical protein [Gracilibacillus saliphilus]|uniref:hypothetical protein n=1 Tax=Gracilibacillus saliphilus TaxID=543890 RepID=UPI0013D2FB19|nr:hypothetical protein [Gracilibacillus saliphilus]